MRPNFSFEEARMAQSFDVVTFDCYGTLIDWESGLVQAFAEASTADGVQLDPHAVLHVLFDAHPKTGYQPYRERLADAALRVSHQLGWRISRERAAFLAESLARWTPFPDTNPALERLRDAGYALGILSNVDDDLLADTLRHLTVPFEFTVTAQQVRSYKPALAHFHAGRERVAGRRWLHVAQGYIYDVAPCAQLGIPVAWINRKGETAPARPGREFGTLTELADWLGQPR
jgi:2-haloalkanoic acid dehalogenase type II